VQGKPSGRDVLDDRRRSHRRRLLDTSVRFQYAAPVGRALYAQGEGESKVTQGVATTDRQVSLQQRAARVLPSGVTHDVRWRQPPGPYFERGLGARKWDVDGQEYVDFVQGHGALLLGIAHPDVTDAIADALRRGSHLGGNHPGEVEWAELVTALVPCAERVRFTSSGTEASLLALRLARIATGRDVVLKLPGHFHGWHDYVMVGIDAPFEVPSSPGLPRGALGTVDVVDEDPDAVEARLAQGDVAALILEPTGASWGTAPLDDAGLRRFAASCRRHGVILVLDEVISGFRAHPGGLQAVLGVEPDLCVLGKVLAGGMPGGAVAGRAGLFEPLELRADPAWNRDRHSYHPGTFNANPISATAGIAALGLVRTGSPTADADRAAIQLREGLAEAFADAPIPAVVYGAASWFHVLVGVDEPPRDIHDAKRGDAELAGRLDRALLGRGVDTLRLGGFVGIAHGPAEIDLAVEAYRAALRDVAEESAS
jgi:glutamate-1-semialdehyde 2,1-aminomutase